jgi:hypothetical protein
LLKSRKFVAFFAAHLTYWTFSVEEFVCFHGRPRQTTDVPQPNWLFVPPAFDVPTLVTGCPRAYRRTLAAEVGTYGRGIRTGNLA